MKIGLWIVATLALSLAVYGLHWWFLSLEQRGIINYLKKPAGGGLSSSMLELDKLTRPSVEHVIEAQDFRGESQEHNGE